VEKQQSRSPGWKQHSTTSPFNTFRSRWKYNNPARRDGNGRLFRDVDAGFVWKNNNPARRDGNISLRSFASLPMFYVEKQQSRSPGWKLLATGLTIAQAPGWKNNNPARRDGNIFNHLSPSSLSRLRGKTTIPLAGMETMSLIFFAHLAYKWKNNNPARRGRIALRASAWQFALRTNCVRQTKFAPPPKSSCLTATAKANGIRPPARRASPF